MVDFDNNQMKGNSSVKFSIEELRDLFTLSENTSCETHDLLSCDCGGSEVGMPCLLSRTYMQVVIGFVHLSVCDHQNHQISRSMPMINSF